MKSRSRFPLFQLFCGVMLLCVLLGWLIVIFELVQRDAEVSENRIKLTEERYLQDLVDRFDKNLEVDGELLTKAELVKAAVESGDFSGVWGNSFIEERSSVGVEAWPDSIDPKSSDDLLHLKVAREEKELFRGINLLREGVLNDSGVDLGDARKGLMSPGFKLLLIAELEKWEPSEKLERLKIALRILAVEGHVEQLSEEFEEILTGQNGLRYFYTKEQIEKKFDSDEAMLFENRPEDRASIRLQGLEKWPYLSMKEGEYLDGKAFSKSKTAIYFVGGGTLISTIGLIFAAVWLARRKLEEARSQTDLAASVAHELRTPLAGQRVVLESMLERKDYDEEYLGMALRENCRLSDLSEEFLTFSRLERGVLELQLRSHDLRELLEPMVDDFKKQYDDVELRLQGDFGVMALVDEAAVVTVARNLIENAWKYSEGVKNVEISIADGGEEVSFLVKDEGRGLSTKDCKRVFRQFYRVEKKVSRNQDGLGLGLAIVKRLVDGMDGRIEVESEQGRGSVFSVFLKKGGEE